MWNNEAFIFAVYGPLIVTSSVIVALYGKWAFALLQQGGDDRPRLFHLIAGITLGFLVVAIENGYWALSRLSEHGTLGQGLKGLDLDQIVATIVVIKVFLWVAGVMHLHAYWLAQYGKSWWTSWLVLSAIWYIAVALLFSMNSMNFGLS